MSGTQRGARAFVEAAAARCGVELSIRHEIEAIGLKRELLLRNRCCTIVSLGPFIDDVQHGVFSARRIVKPIQALERSVKAVAGGDYSQSVPFTDASDETGGLAELYAAHGGWNAAGPSCGRAAGALHRHRRVRQRQRGLPARHDRARQDHARKTVLPVEDLARPPGLDPDDHLVVRL